MEALDLDKIEFLKEALENKEVTPEELGYFFDPISGLYKETACSRLF